MVIIKSVYLYKLILKIDLIRLLLVGTIKSLSFITDLFKVMLFFFFLYSNIALYLYGGGMNSGSSVKFEERFGDELGDSEFLFNFNDYFNCFNSLLIIMLTGFADYTKFLTLRDEISWWNNIYFISFFFITNIIFLNILTGLICDSTDAMMSNEE